MLFTTHLARRPQLRMWCMHFVGDFDWVISRQTFRGDAPARLQLGLGDAAGRRLPSGFWPSSERRVECSVGRCRGVLVRRRVYNCAAHACWLLHATPVRASDRERTQRASDTQGDFVGHAFRGCTRGY